MSHNIVEIILSDKPIIIQISFDKYLLDLVLAQIFPDLLWNTA